MNETMIRIDELSVRFNGANALDRISTRAGSGEVIGLIGRNGSGKTTLLETLAGLIRPTAGRSWLLESDSSSLDDRVREQLGYVFQEDELFGWMRVADHVRVVAAHYPNWDDDRAQALVDRWRIDPRSRVERLSRGQRQLLGIILAICHRPRVLLLDEPASALDPVTRRDFLAELIDLACDENRVLVLASHLLSDVERVASRIWLLRDGRLLLDEELDQLKEELVRIEIPDSASVDNIPIPGEVGRRRSGNREIVVARNPGADHLERLREAGGGRVNVRHLNLEQIALEFLE